MAEKTTLAKQVEKICVGIASETPTRGQVGNYLYAVEDFTTHLRKFNSAKSDEEEKREVEMMQIILDLYKKDSEIAVEYDDQDFLDLN